jgi:hypothetical protein
VLRYRSEEHRDLKRLRDCTICGRPNRTTRKRKFCSVDCKKEHQYRLGKNKRQRAILTRERWKAKNAAKMAEYRRRYNADPANKERARLGLERRRREFFDATGLSLSSEVQRELLRKKSITQLQQEIEHARRKNKEQARKFDVE